MREKMLHIIGLSCLMVLSSKLFASQQYGVGQTVSVEDLVAVYAQGKHFSPLPSNENPLELLNFIGPVDRLITVPLATLPTFFSRFSRREVVVVDNRAAQLRFSRMLQAAFLNGKLEEFSKGMEESFISYHQENIPNSYPLQRFFESIYRPLKNLSPLGAVPIQTKIASIFEENPSGNSTIFLSTILELESNKLEENLSAIYNWCVRGNSVVFSLTNISNHEYILNKLKQRHLSVREFLSTCCVGTIYYEIYL